MDATKWHERTENARKLSRKMPALNARNQSKNAENAQKCRLKCTEKMPKSGHPEQNFSPAGTARGY